MSKKVEALVNGLHKLAHAGQLDKEELIALGPELGVTQDDRDGVDSEGYFDRIHQTLRSEDGLAQLKTHYGTMSTQDRRNLGAKINEVRRR